VYRVVNNLSETSNIRTRDMIVNGLKKHLQIKGTEQAAGTIQKLRKSLCDWDQTQVRKTLLINLKILI